MLQVDYAVLPLHDAPDDPDLLDEAERARAARFARDDARRRFVVVRRALRVELARRLGVPPRAVSFAFGDRGKPTLAPELDSAAITFSVAHAGEYALLAFAHAAAIGVDLERVRAVRHEAEIARRVLRADERAAIEPLRGDARREAFFRLWTRREALVKCMGGSILEPPSAPSSRYAVAEVPAPVGYVAALCADAPSVCLVERPLYSAG